MAHVSFALGSGNAKVGFHFSSLCTRLSKLVSCAVFDSFELGVYAVLSCWAGGPFKGWAELLSRLDFVGAWSALLMSSLK